MCLLTTPPHSIHSTPEPPRTPCVGRASPFCTTPPPSSCLLGTLPQEQTPFSLECPRQSQGVRDILPRTRRLCGGQTTRVAHRGNGLLEPLALRCADTRPQPSCFTRGISEQAARGCPLLLVDLSHSRSQAPCDKMAGREGRV